MKEISNISDLKKGKIYYIEVYIYDFLWNSLPPKIKVKGNFLNYSEKENCIYFINLEYINDYYNHYNPPFCKPILLKLYIKKGNLYRLISGNYTNQIDKFIELYKSCKIYEPENERILVNFVMRNKIINDPYFNYS